MTSVSPIDGLGLGSGWSSRPRRLRLDGVGDRLGDGLGLDRGGDRLGLDGRRPADDVVERRRLGQVLGHGREAARVLLAEEALEERGHLVLERGDGLLDRVDLALDDAGVLLDLGLEAAPCAR